MSVCKPRHSQINDFAASGSARMSSVTEDGFQIGEDDFHIHHLIDTGGFGFVFKATQNATGAAYALKIQPQEFMARLTRAGGTRQVNRRTLHVERNVLIECRGHPFVVNLEYAFCTPLYAVLAMQYIPGGTLTRLISSVGTLPLEIAQLYTAELALALNHLHANDIIYR